MSDDCVQCREWELCPFHPKQKPVQEEWDEPTDIVWNLASDVPEVNLTCTYAVTADGQYVQTWQDGKLVDEEPIEAYPSIVLQSNLGAPFTR